MRVIVWSFNVLATGEWPAFRHDGTALDERRAALQGPLAGGFAGALVEMRADLLEFTTALGFKTWANNDKPCFCCSVDKASLYEFPATYRNTRFEPLTAEAFAALVARSLTTVTFDEPSFLQLQRWLSFDTGSPGLRLLVPMAGLEAGARVLVGGDVVDLKALHELVPPVSITFLKPGGMLFLNFISELFSIVGFTIASLALDVMHVVDLGVLQWLVAAVFWALINGNFCGSAKIHLPQRHLDNILALNARMRAYYSVRKHLTRIGRLTVHMLGPASDPRLHAKAAETRHLLGLAVTLVADHPAIFDGHNRYLAAAVGEMSGFFRVMRNSPRSMPEEDLHALQQHVTKFLTFWRAWGGEWRYKHHCFWHIAERAAWNGNPRFSHTYADENENRLMSKTAKALHGGPTFYRAFLERVVPDVL